MSRSDAGRRGVGLSATARRGVTRRYAVFSIALCESRGWPVLRTGHHLGIYRKDGPE